MVLSSQAFFLVSLTALLGTLLPSLMATDCPLDFTYVCSNIGYMKAFVAAGYANRSTNLGVTSDLSENCIDSISRISSDKTTTIAENGPILRTTERGEAVKDVREEVIQAWYMDDSQEDQRLPHHKDPEEFISLDKLAELGVVSWRLDADNYDTDEELKKIRKAGGYSYMDFCEVCPEKLPNYEEKIKSFFEEHLHIDDEIRYCVAGTGYFDVRDRDEAWIRVWVKKGGMIVFPAGIYHRFTVDSDNYIKAMRLFVGGPVWTPYNRPHDHLPARKEYIDKFVKVT